VDDDDDGQAFKAAKKKKRVNKVQVSKEDCATKHPAIFKAGRSSIWDLGIFIAPSVRDHAYGPGASSLSKRYKEDLSDKVNDSEERAAQEHLNAVRILAPKR
jgi:hypothetical protein